MSDPIDQSDYEYSEEKRIELLRQAGLTPEDVKEMESEEYTITSEEKYQLLVFIRNYDSDGKLTESPTNAIKTCIDTFERSVEIFKWNTKDIQYNEDGSHYYIKTPHREVKVTSNGSLFADEEILKVEPHIIEGTRFLDVFIKSYFEKYQTNPIADGKTLFIELHNTTDKYKFYEFTSEDILYYKSKNYDKIGLNLDNNNYIIDTDKVLDINTFSLEKVNLIIKNETGLMIKANTLYFNIVKIDSSFKDIIAQIALTITEYANISYITFTDDICEFDFLNPVESNMQKWMKTRIEIYGIDFINLEKEYSYKLENLFRFDSFYNVNINSLNISMKSSNISFLKFVNVMNVNISSINLYSKEGFNKNIISLRKVTNFTGCSITGAQDKVDRDVYLLSTNKGGIMGEYKFTTIIANNIGLISCLSESILQLSFNNSKCLGFPKPIKYIDSSINKMIFSNCYFDKIKELAIGTPKISIFESKFTNIENLNLIPSEKLYISNSSISGEKLSIQITDDGMAFIDESKVDFKTIEVNGDNATGNYKQLKSNIICNDFIVKYLNKLSSDNTDLSAKSIDIIGKNITGFDPHIIDSKLKTVSISGNIKNSLLLIDNKTPVKITYNIDKCKGDFNINYYNKISDIILNVNASKIKLNIESSSEISEETKIDVTCRNDCTGSIFTSYNDKLLFFPQAEGSFVDFKKYYKEDDLTKSKWKEKIAYGNK